MNENYTHISVILDRTGSMESIRDDTIGGFNAFLKTQQQQDGIATLTLVQFDTQNPYEVIHQFAPIQAVPELTRQAYVPRASTPLLDAIGRGINDLEQRLDELDAPRKPARVVFVIITDGQENSSREFRKEQIVKMLTHKEKKDGWQFVFLSADLDSMDDAMSYGFKKAAAMSYDKNAQGTASAWASLSTSISDYRKDKAASISFSEKDRRQQDSEKKRKKRWGWF